MSIELTGIKTSVQDTKKLECGALAQSSSRVLGSASVWLCISSVSTCVTLTSIGTTDLSHICTCKVKISHFPIFVT